LLQYSYLLALAKSHQRDRNRESSILASGDRFASDRIKVSAQLDRNLTWLVGGWWLVVDGWRLVVGGWWLVVGGWWLMVGGWLLQKTNDQ
jgi:hypothetical protein